MRVDALLRARGSVGRQARQAVVVVRSAMVHPCAHAAHRCGIQTNEPEDRLKK